MSRRGGRGAARRRSYGVDRVLELFQVEGGPNDWGVWVGDVTYPHDAGGRTVSVGLALEWEPRRARGLE